MAKAPSSWRRSKVVKDHPLMISECDVDAAQNLMQQLSDEEDTNNITRNKRSRSMDERKVDQRLSDIIMAKIQEIFGNDVEVFPTKKQRRYRSLVSIYTVTTPVNAGNDTRVKA
ncbi:hypothetical protein CR513_23902, partial [Mucuna pruriens]